MKLIIDIPEETYIELKVNNYWADRQTHELLEEAVINATPIEEHSELFNDLKQGLQEAIELEKEQTGEIGINEQYNSNNVGRDC